MDSHLTPYELATLNLSDLPRTTPFVIAGVSQGFFSVARDSMGCTFQGQYYSYVPPTDELIRVDVVKWLAKFRKAAPAAEAPPRCDRTIDLFED